MYYQVQMVECAHVRCHTAGPFGSRFVKSRNEQVPYLLCVGCRDLNKKRYEKNGAKYRAQQLTPKAQKHIVKNRNKPERKEAQRVYGAQYRADPNGAAVVARHSKAVNDRIMANPALRLEATLTSSIRSRLGGVRYGESVNISNYTDFKSYDDLMAHFKAQLKPGMTMENYGEFWSVAHKIPKCYYDFSDKEEISRCNSKANLGCDYEVWPNPLNERTNASKGGKMPTLEELYEIVKSSWPKLFGQEMTDQKRDTLWRHHQ